MLTCVLSQVKGSLVQSEPYQACSTIANQEEVQGKIALAQRGGCMFAAKARNLQGVGASGVIFIGECLELSLADR